MTASLHKLTAGDGYEYLTRQVAAQDSTNLGRQELADYYSEKGEQPGRWMGRGLAGIQGVEVGDQVSAEQMKALFGMGRHPEMDALIADQIAAGKTIEEALKATELGSVFADLNDKPSTFRVEVTRAFNEFNKARGLPRSAAIPEEERSAIRSRIGRELFTQTRGRAPLNDRELSGFIARESRPPRQQVAGYDVTFSAVKSVSILWGTASREVSEVLESAHDAAVRDVIKHLEDEVLFTRRGKGGVLHVPVRGVLATAFTHRDSRLGDPDLHTHVAISNKVQDPRDGAWLAIDGQVLHKAVVGLSERYNTALEREVNRRLGLEFTERPDTIAEGKRPVRELRGFTPDIIKGMSSRRTEIEHKASELQAEFRATHRRTPSPKESVVLYQQANLATRERKRPARSFAELRERWQHHLSDLLGADQDVEGFVEQVLAQTSYRDRTLTDEQVDDVAGRVVSVVEAARARFSVDHLVAQAEREIRTLGVSPDTEAATVERVINAALTDRHTVRIGVPDDITDPAILADARGRSLFDKPRAQLHTTTRILDAERRIVQASLRRGARTISPETVATALLEQVANGRELDASQAQMVTEMATTDRYVQLCLAPAGSGKTTSMRVLTRAWQDGGGTVLGLAPSAAAAAELRGAIDTPTDTLAKLVFHVRHPDAAEPWWMRDIGPSTMVLIDEAGMASTTDLDAAIGYLTARGATVRLVGDDQQLSSIAAGGVLREIAHEAGAVTLSELHRFTDPAEAANTLLLRDGNVEALGFLLDNQRVQVAGEAEAPGRVYAAWLRDQQAGKTALMIAHSGATVTDLNHRARLDRVAAGLVDDTRTVTLAGDVPCGAGDVIVSRQNRRDLALTRTDFVKNGDRFIVEAVTPTGGLQVRHEQLGRTITLPPDYVRDQVKLGYASTIHDAQGQTVDSSFVLLTGQENRQLAYVALTRGRSMNGVVLPLGGDGDPHAAIQPDTVLPPTAVELMEQVIRRDGAQVAALTEQRLQSAPASLLARAAERYEAALQIAAVDAVGAERMAQLTEAAEHVVPGVTGAPAWDTLAAHLAIVDLSGVDPIDRLRDAAHGRELDTARDIAAVLDFRLDSSGGRSAGTGPLPWMLGIPTQLATHPEYGDWLRARFTQVTQHRDDLRDLVTSQEPHDAPEWAVPLVDSAGLHAEIAMWRAVHRVPDTDTSPTGPSRPAVKERAHQQRLVERFEEVAGSPILSGQAWAAIVTEHDAAVTRDPWWPVLASRLDLAAAANLPVREQLDAALARGPLPDEHAAAALWSRLAPSIAPKAVVTAIMGSGAARLRPSWSQDLTDLLPEGLGRRVMADPQWPLLVASVTEATHHTGLPARDVISQAIDLIGADHLPTAGTSGEGRLPASALATMLAWRVHDLTTPPPEHTDLVPVEDFHDPDVDDFLRKIAAEQAEPATLVSDDDWPTHFRVEPPTDLEALPQDPAAIPSPDLATETPGPDRDRVVELNTAAAEWFAGHYPDSPAQQHLVARFGVDPTEHGYLCGYAPPTPGRTGLVDHLRTTHHATDDELLAASLGQWRGGQVIDFFRDRAMIGIRNARGHLVGFTGRDLTGYDKTPKYKNTAETAAFTKGKVLFGLHEGITAPTPSDSAPQPPARPVLVEGPMDAIAVTIAAQGAAYGAAAGGTALTDYQADLLAHAAVDDQGPTVWVGLDNDPAGRRAAWTAFDKLVGRGVTPRGLVFPGNDPGEAFEHHRAVLDSMLTPTLLPQAPVLIDNLTDDVMRPRHTPVERLMALDYLPAKIAALPPQHWERAITYAIDAALPGDRQTEPGYVDQQTATFIDKVADAAQAWDQNPAQHASSTPTGRPSAQVPELKPVVATPRPTPAQSTTSGTGPTPNREEQIEQLRRTAEELRRRQEERLNRDRRRTRDDAPSRRSPDGPTLS